ncbi:MAG: low molecular weight phosphatase family protein, partial [Gemmatimonadaceae bacterium]
RSAGFIGPGRQSPPNALRAASGRGIDMAAHRSQVLEPGIVRAADLVITMDARQAREIRERFGKPSWQVLLLGDFDPVSSHGRTIMDPVDLSVEVFDGVYARIEQCARELARAILGSSGALA